MDNHEIVQTRDGSATLISKVYDEAYHNVNGAIAEAVHIYGNAALNFDKANLNILEFGYGTGLNAMMTYKLLTNQQRNIYYVGVDLYPLNFDLILKLGNYKIIGLTYELAKCFCDSWNETLKIDNNFSLLKVQTDIVLFTSEQKFDLVYYDAFSPDIQPELWTKEVFEKIYSLLNHGAKLYTYSSKGSVKRNLRAAGFFVKRLDGPPGKRHIIEAEKILLE